MTWVKVDDHIDEHPKIVAVGPLGFALFIAGIAYSNRNLTDGFIPRAVARKLVECDEIMSVIDTLLEANLWETGEVGYVVHDYKKYQPSRRKVLAARRKAAQRVREYRTRRKQESNGDVTPLHRENFTRSNAPPTPVPTPSLPKEERKTSAPAAPSPRKPRKPDHVWDTLCVLFGEPSNDVERGVRNAAVRHLKQSLKAEDLTEWDGVDVIVSRASSWPYKFPRLTLTASALAKHWTNLGRPDNNGAIPRRKTGWRWVRSAASGTYKRDPDGMDQPPAEFLASVKS